MGSEMERFYYHNCFILLFFMSFRPSWSLISSSKYPLNVMWLFSGFGLDITGYHLMFFIYFLNDSPYCTCHEFRAKGNVGHFFQSPAIEAKRKILSNNILFTNFFVFLFIIFFSFNPL